MHYLEKVKLIHIFWIYVFLIGFIFICIIPPFQKADEQTHYYRSVALAKGQFLCQKTQGKHFFTISKDEFQLPTRLQFSIRNDYEKKYHLSDIPKISSFKINENSEQYILEGWCGLGFVGHLPNATGVVLGNLLDNLLFSFYFGRLFGFIFFAGCLYYSIKIIPRRYLPYLLFVASTPMTIHQVTSYSYDGTHFSLGLLVFSYIAKFFENDKVDYKSFLRFTLILTLFVISKPGYLFFAIPFIFFIFSKTKLIPIRTKALLILAVASTLLISILSARNFSIKSVYSLTNPSIQLQLLFDNPTSFLNIIEETINTKFPLYLAGVVGGFGWLDFQLDPYWYYAYFLLIGILVTNNAIKRDPPDISFPIISIIIVVTNSLLIFASMYLLVTPTSYPTVEGIQGRYFIVLVPFILVALEELIRITLKSKRIAKALIALIILVLLLSLGRSIFRRYYDYPKLYFSPNPLSNKIGDLLRESKYQTKDLSQKPMQVVLQSNRQKIYGVRMITILKDIPFAFTPIEVIFKTSDCKNEYTRAVSKNYQINNLSYLNFEVSPFVPKQNSVCIEVRKYKSSDPLDEGKLGLVFINDSLYAEILHVK